MNLDEYLLNVLQKNPLSYEDLKQRTKGHYSWASVRNAIWRLNKAGKINNGVFLATD